MAMLTYEEAVETVFSCPDLMDIILEAYIRDVVSENSPDVEVKLCSWVSAPYDFDFRRAARKIIAHIEGSEVSETETYLVKPHLIIRDSIKKV